MLYFSLYGLLWSDDLLLYSTYFFVSSVVIGRRQPHSERGQRDMRVSMKTFNSVCLNVALFISVSVSADVEDVQHFLFSFLPFFFF